MYCPFNHFVPPVAGQPGCLSADGDEEQGLRLQQAAILQENQGQPPVRGLKEIVSQDCGVPHFNSFVVCPFRSTQPLPTLSQKLATSLPRLEQMQRDMSGIRARCIGSAQKPDISSVYPASYTYTRGSVFFTEILKISELVFKKDSLTRREHCTVFHSLAIKS